MQYYFVDFPADEEPQEIFFCKSTEIFRFNIHTSTWKTVHKFKVALRNQPMFYVLSSCQETHCLASLNDGLWYSEHNHEEVDIDLLLEIDIIKCLIFDEEDNEFYILSNKKKGFIGFFLTTFHEVNPYDHTDLTMIKNRLDIDSVNLFILRG